MAGERIQARGQCLPWGKAGNGGEMWAEAEVDLVVLKTFLPPALPPLHIKMIKMKTSKTHSSKENGSYLNPSWEAPVGRLI